MSLSDICKSLSLGITIRVSSTSLMPELLLLLEQILLPSNPKGLVTTPTVRAPSSCATSTIIGDAPVPVPPPPAVINHIGPF